MEAVSTAVKNTIDSQPRCEVRDSMWRFQRLMLLMGRGGSFLNDLWKVPRNKVINQGTGFQLSERQH
jgi:hypothetical protein